MPGATVTLKNAGTGIVANTVSDDKGDYEFLNVRISSYAVGAELQGFSAAEAEGGPGNGQRAHAPRPGAQGRQRRRDRRGHGRGDPVEEQIQRSRRRRQGTNRQPAAERPRLRRPGAAQPGVRRSAICDSRDASFNVNGLRSAVNSFILDGVDNNSYGTSNQGFSNQVVQLSPDAVEEFKVQTNNFSAEFGRTGGAVVDTSMRSGTDNCTGSASRSSTATTRSTPPGSSSRRAA